MINLNYINSKNFKVITIFLKHVEYLAYAIKYIQIYMYISIYIVN